MTLILPTPAFSWVELESVEFQNLDSSYNDMIVVRTQGSGGSSLVYKGLNIFNIKTCDFVEIIYY